MDVPGIVALGSSPWDRLPGIVSLVGSFPWDRHPCGGLSGIASPGSSPPDRVNLDIVFPSIGQEIVFCSASGIVSSPLLGAAVPPGVSSAGVQTP